MIYEKSCGAVIFRRNKDDVEFLVIQHRNQKHFSFPKGHQEKNETDEQTALREIKEETGLNVVLHTEYHVTTTYQPKPNTIKDVVFYLAETKDHQVTLQEEEVMSFAWLSRLDVLNRLTYQSDKDAFMYLTQSVI